MLNTHAVAVALCTENGLLDKLILEENLPKSDRDFLTSYKAILAAGITRRDHDRQMIDIFRKWTVFHHKY